MPQESSDRAQRSVNVPPWFLNRYMLTVSDGSLQQLVPQCSGTNALAEYYRHVSLLFEHHGQDGPVIYFGQLAVRSARSSDFATKDILTKVFMANVALGLYEDAYSILTNTPSLEL
jgi:nuclear pore complex protein Nup160